MLGPIAPWFILAACLLSVGVRIVDTRSWSLFIPGGLVGRVDRAFGPRAGLLAATVSCVERVSLAALACVVVGRYVHGEPHATSRGARPVAGSALTAVVVSNSKAVVLALFVPLIISSGCSTRPRSRLVAAKHRDRDLLVVGGLQRERGVVYSPERARAALENFFKESTLVALRELAMRQTAHTVESRHANDTDLTLRP